LYYPHAAADPGPTELEAKAVVRRFLENKSRLHRGICWSGFKGLFPEIRVARLNVSGGLLNESQQALVESAMKRVNVDGLRGGAVSLAFPQSPR